MSEKSKKDAMPTSAERPGRVTREALEAVGLRVREPPTSASTRAKFLHSVTEG